MGHTTRQEIARYWKQADNNLERFLEDCQQMAKLFEIANVKYDDQYADFSDAVEGFGKIIILVQNNWRELKRKKL